MHVLPVWSEVCHHVVVEHIHHGDCQQAIKALVLFRDLATQANDLGCSDCDLVRGCTSSSTAEREVSRLTFDPSRRLHFIILYNLVEVQDDSAIHRSHPVCSQFEARDEGNEPVAFRLYELRLGIVEICRQWIFRDNICNVIPARWVVRNGIDDETHQ